MRQLFRVHGDNIVECERIVSYIIRNTILHSYEKVFSSLACLTVIIDFEYAGTEYLWAIEMFPGFSKDNRSQRWQTNIFDTLKANGSFLDETPDAVVTKIIDGLETVLFAIEFCSALQAGNQAWQRSGRAYSIGRTTCPYIYIVDFGKYELDSKTRERKALRFPNPVVPFSYISFSKQTNSFVAQAYVKAEEFRQTDEIFHSFENEWFSETLVCDFIVEKMLGLPTTQTELKILNNNLNVVMFLASGKNEATDFCADDWQAIFDSNLDIIEYTKSKTDEFKFSKKISQKAQAEGTKIKEFSSAIQEMSVGIASEDLPFGLLHSNKISNFVSKLKSIYPTIASEFDVLSSISEDCIVCMLKGFKPRGDDNRPDRGIPPLIAMLTSEKNCVLSYIYGPLIERNYHLLLSDPMHLSKINGFWRAHLSLSDFLMLDAPVLGTDEIVNKFIDNREIKQNHISQKNTSGFEIATISNVPNGYHEDDVDTVLHYMFSYLLDNTFEGMCNPPGGDWSGLSVRYNNCEYRWLSLPRVSNNSKRPDHVTELFIPNEKPILFVVESKEQGSKLEMDIGSKLKDYIHWLMDFTPSVSRLCSGEWYDAEHTIDPENFEIISVGAYIANSRDNTQQILEKSKCDLLFIFTPDVDNNYWKIEIIASANSTKADEIKNTLLEQLAEENNEIYITIATPTTEF